MHVRNGAGPFDGPLSADLDFNSSQDHFTGHYFSAHEYNAKVRQAANYIYLPN
jgi:hypothetical protein